MVRNNDTLDGFMVIAPELLWESSPFPSGEELTQIFMNMTLKTQSIDCFRTTKGIIWQNSTSSFYRPGVTLRMYFPRLASSAGMRIRDQNLLFMFSLCPGCFLIQLSSVVKFCLFCIVYCHIKFKYKIWQREISSLVKMCFVIYQLRSLRICIQKTSNSSMSFCL